MRRMKLLAALAALTLVVSACGDDGAAGTTTSVPATTEATTTIAAPAATEASVLIEGFAFDPPQLTVPVGTTVTWTNQDGATHTATAADGAFDSGNLSGGSGTYSHTFTTAGTFDYLCSIHPSMQGTIVVTE